MTDLLLAVCHHLAVFTLVAILAVEFSLLGPGLSGAGLKRVARLDGAYGATAGLVILIGVARVVWGLKGWAYYQHNPWFWGKMAAFAAIGGLSILPTAALLKWRKAANADAAFLPPAAAVARLRTYVGLELALVAVVVACAAAMARLG
ncbi:MAG: hypothetical protein JWO33_1798 [Caulobacteraceae bacterium]|nr:hypothetical protein [Caulobacteraceae bacterium]